jgi:hypothetical protein
MMQNLEKYVGKEQENGEKKIKSIMDILAAIIIIQHQLTKMQKDFVSG